MCFFGKKKMKLGAPKPAKPEGSCSMQTPPRSPNPIYLFAPPHFNFWLCPRFPSFESFSTAFLPGGKHRSVLRRAFMADSSSQLSPNFPSESSSPSPPDPMGSLSSDSVMSFGERAISAAGAAVLSAIIVNPLDVAKVSSVFFYR